MSDMFIIVMMTLGLALFLMGLFVLSESIMILGLGVWVGTGIACLIQDSIS